MKAEFTLILNIVASFVGLSQTSTTPDIAVKSLSSGTVQFSTTLRPLCPIAGAPVPRYSYFWEFGDGTFSDAPFEASPTHSYKKSGSYNVLLVATNTYDNCTTPPFRQQKVSVVGAAEDTKWTSGFFGGSENSRSIKIKVNREPRPGDDFVTYVGYRNRLGNISSGSIILFFNDKRFYKKSFNLLDKRTYHGEESLSEVTNYASTARKAYNLVRTLQKKYIDAVAFRFNDLKAADEHFIFMTLQMLPEMSKELDQVITFTAVVIPDNPSADPDKYELSTKIARSYDPNRLLVRERYSSYRRMKKKRELNYKVEFQNLGAAPAKNVSIRVAVPKQLDVSTLKTNRVVPTSLSCDSISYPQQSCFESRRSADTIEFYLKNIYLPGLEQKLVKSPDSTKGSIEYSIRFKNKLKKRAVYSRAVIDFDDNPPIYTNTSMAWFKNGLSPGIMAGYSFILSGNGAAQKNSFKAAFVLAPYASTVPYFQFELHAFYSTHEDTTEPIRMLDPAKDKVPIPKEFNIKTGTIQTRIQTTKRYLQIVPAHLRKDITDWLGIGVGVMGQLQILEKTTTTHSFQVNVTRSNGGSQPYDTSFTNSEVNRGIARTKVLANANFEPFFDVQVGKVKTGLVFGLRYYRSFDGDDRSRFLVYTGFKL